MSAKFQSVSLLLAASFVLTLAFNVDIPSAITHRGPSGSYFGFSVDLHKDRGINWLLVGAPTAQTRQPGVNRGGSVYRCSTDISDQCEPIPFDVTGNNNISGQQIDQKSEQWFGATVRSAGPNGPVVACAPRYVWYSNNYKRREPVGTCFVARNSFGEISEYSPCRTTNWGYHRQGSCQAGLGAAVSPDGLRLFVGAVGSWYWQGQLHSINITHSAVRSPVFRTFVTGQVFTQNLFSRLDILSTSEGSASEDDSYLGYSTAVGDLDNDGKTDVAVGMPRGANLTGKVVMFAANLNNIANITGQQLGAYFGYCLTVTDIDGDGLQDVIVGAPLYTNYANTEGKYETGRVSVFYQSIRNTFRRTDSLDGEVSKARFGLSVAALGDINLDGFNDIAVGAPYDGPNERGAVYIFHGSAKGIRNKASQVVYAEQITNDMSTFGFSLSGGMDMDGNEYPDVVVGAYNSDRVVYMRSRPVVYLNTVDISYDVDSKQIDLENRNCRLLDGTAVACVPLTLCFEYTGRGVNQRQDVQVQLLLDSKNPKNPRLHFITAEGRSSLNQTYALTKGQRTCRTHTVYVRPLIRDKLTPIESEVRYSLIEAADARRRNRRDLPPVLGADSPSKTDVIVIQKNCGPDNVCIPDMQVTAKTNMDRYVLGSGSRLEIEVSVLNAAEDAFEATVSLTLPAEVSFVKVDRAEKSDTSILCSPPTEESGHVLRCDIGNPLPAFRSAIFTIHLQPNAMLARENAAIALAIGQKVKTSLDFVLEVNSTNPEEASQLLDNRLEISLPIRVETDLNIRGVSDPEVVHFNLSDYTSSKSEVKSHEKQVGPQVIHIYELGNRGPSDILQADVYILWPTKTLSGKDLLYLVDRPFVDGPANCQLLEQFNPLALKLESERLSSASRTVSVSGSRTTSITGSRSGSSSHSVSSGTRVTSGGSSTSSSSSRSSSSSSSSSSVGSGGSSTGGRYSSSSRTGSFGSSGSGSSGSSSSGSFGSSSSRSSGSSATGSSDSYGSGSSRSSSTGSSGSFGSGSSRSSSTGSSDSFDSESSGSFGSGSSRSSGTGSSGSFGSGSSRSSSTGTSGSFGSGSSRSSSTGSSDSFDSESSGSFGSGSSRSSSTDSSGSFGSGSSGTSGSGRTTFEWSGAGSGHNTISSSDDDGRIRTGSWNRTRTVTRYRPDGTIESRVTTHRDGPGVYDDDLFGEEEESLSEDYEQETQAPAARPSAARNRGRAKRQSKKNLDRELNCGATQCTIIRCSAGPITANNNVVFKLRARIWAQTIAEIEREDLVISSKLVVDIRELPYGVDPAYLPLRSASVTTPLEQLDKEREAKAIPWWIIVLAAVAGVLLLLLLIFILWKLGFFKRKRPDKNDPDQEPLKSENGHLQRDEAL